MDSAVSGITTNTGLRISGDSALSYSAVFCAVSVISQAVASLPFLLYSRLPDKGKKLATEHPLFHALRVSPNSEMTSYSWKEITMSHLLLWGNSYSEMRRDGLGRTAELWPLNPATTKIKRSEGGNIYYEVTEKGGKKRTLQSADVLHIPGLGYDGRVGYSVIRLAKESMALGLGMETFQSRFYGSGTNPGSVFQHPGKLSKETHEQLRKDLNATYSGLGNSQKTIILEEGMEYKKMGMPLSDAEFMSSRVFQLTEICRWFSIQPSKLQELSHGTYSNVAQAQLAFLTDTLRPWLVRLESYILWKALDKNEQQELFAEFLIDAILRADPESRNKALSIQRMNGIINADQWRAMINMNPIGGPSGQTYLVPLNMVDSGNGGIVEMPASTDTKEGALKGDD